VKHPDQNEAARRALCLGALVMRSKFESIAESASAPMIAVHEELATQLNIWIADEGLIASQSTWEKPLVCQALGSWTRQELIEASWRVNSLGVILWALSQFEELPSWDTQFTPQESIRPLNLFASTGPFLDKVRLRSEAEIEKTRYVAELWHWRAQKPGSMPADMKADTGGGLDEAVRAAASEAYARGDIAEPIDGDFPLFGKSFSNLSDEERTIASSIALERHYALNWLCGYAADWDEVPTGT